jgi:hypothetical protein
MGHVGPGRASQAKRPGRASRLKKFCIFHNLFNNIGMSLCDSKDII